MIDIVQEAEEWLRATDGKRSNPVILIKSLVNRITDLECQLDEGDNHIAYLEAKLDRFV